MKTKLFITLIIFTILFTSFSAAEIIIEKYAEGYTAGSPITNPQVCICGEATDEIIIRNDAPYPQVFELSTNIEQAFLSINQVTLNPQQEITIPIIMTADCKEKTRTEEYNILIKTTSGTDQIIKRNLEIQKCQTIDLKLYSEKNTTNICEATTYSILLKNPSTTTEDYLIGPLTNTEFFDIKGYTVSLKPEQSSIVNFTYQPSCDVNGEQNNVFRVEAKRSNLNAEVTHKLYIIPSYNFTIAGEKELNLCRYETQRITYSITNNGLINNTYDLTLNNAPRFTTLSENTITLKPGETKNFDIIFEPTDKTQNEYEFELIARTKIGNEQINININLNLNNCYDASLSILNPENLEICQGTQTLKVTLKNQGINTETYKLETNTPKATLLNNTITLNPEEETTIDLIIDTTEFTGKILFEVHAYSNKNLLKKWDDSIVLNIYEKEQCSKIEFPSKYIIYSRFKDEIVNIKVQNKGIEKNTYTLTYEGSDYLALNEKQIHLEPKESKEIILNKTREHEQETYYFKLSLSTKEYTHSKEFKLELKDTPLIQKTSEYAKQNPCFMTLLILLATILLMLATHLVFGFSIGKILRIIITTIILAIIIIFLITNGFPEKINPEIEQPEDPYELKIYQNKEHTINLLNYVFDPDNDTLIFKVEDEPTQLNITINNNTLIMTSQELGNDRFRITASDSIGGEVITPRFNVEIIEYKKLTWLEVYEKYCSYFNILILIFILFLINILTKKKTKKRIKKEENTEKTNKNNKKKNKKINKKFQ